MKISLLQLQKHLSTTAPIETLQDILTEIGLEVGKTEMIPSSKEKLKGIIIGKILSCDSHPNADRLKVTTVDIGQKEPLGIICGAPNVAVDQKVAIATIGTNLKLEGKEIKIKASKIRGVLSQGMLCSEKELGIGEFGQGILTLDDHYQVGIPLSKYINWSQDTILEIDITPNRSDAISHLGVSRDLYAALNSRGIDTEKIKISPPISYNQTIKSSKPIHITNHSQERCPRYCGVVISNVTIKPSPKWLQNLLLSLGQKPINNIVDITNYIMQDLGQPLHAFDYEKVERGEINIRLAKEGERIKTLDQKKLDLQNNDLVIADAKKPLCLAGIMGGIDSSVSDQTQIVFLESAYFDPVGVRRSSKKTQIKTESSYRYERGIDPHKTMEFLHQAADMIIDLAGGEIASEFIDLYPQKIIKCEVTFSYKRLDILFGEIFPREKLHQILDDLEIEISEETDDYIKLLVPPFRTDVTREIDIIEEVLRIYGYDNIPVPTHFRFALEPKKKTTSRENVVRNLLASLGYNEVLTSSFSPPRISNLKENANGKGQVFIENALHGNISMRDSMLYSLLEVASHHNRKGREDIKIFEFGKIYKKTTNHNYQESTKLALLISGHDVSKNWHSNPRLLSFYDMKGCITLILKKAGVKDFRLSKELEVLEQFEIFQEGGLFYKSLNIKIGQVKNEFLNHFHLSHPSFFAEIDWKSLEAHDHKEAVSYQEFSKYPSVQRDLSLIIDRNINFTSLQQTARKAAAPYLKNITLFDVYRGKSIEATKQAYGISFTLSKKQGTFTEAEINDIMEKLMIAFAKNHKATLRS